MVGNYFSFQYTPNTSNSLGVNYYTCPYAFYLRGNISGEDNSLFKSFQIGSEEIQWNRVSSGGGFSIDDLITKPTSIYGTFFNDPVLAYQLKQLFPGGIKEMSIFSSTQRNSNGKYYWVLIDKELRDVGNKYNGSRGFPNDKNVHTYVYNYGNGSIVEEGDLANCSFFTRTPGSWKIYIFNTAGQDIRLTFDERIGEFAGSDQSSNGSITNQIELSNGYATSNKTSGWGNYKSSVINLQGEYVTGTYDDDGTEHDNWIKWTADIDFSEYGTNYYDRFTYIFFRLRKCMSFAQGYSFNIPGCSTDNNLPFISDCLYYQTSNGRWTILRGVSSSDKAVSNPPWDQTIWKGDSNASHDLYVVNCSRVAYLPWSCLVNNHLRLVFFTRVDHMSNFIYNDMGTLECGLELHDHSDDLGSRYADGSNIGYSGSSIPTFIAATQAEIIQPSLSKHCSTLHNTAAAEKGDSNASGSKDTAHTPTFPMEAAKETSAVEGNPTSVNWHVTANTGIAGRKNFKIEDVLSAQDANLLAHTSFADMVITIQSGDGKAVEIFNRANGVDQLSNYQATLEKISQISGSPDGDLAFQEDGAYGFRLCFPALDKDTTVDVTYTTKLNSEAYLKDGGTPNTVAALSAAGLFTTLSLNKKRNSENPDKK